MKREDYIKNRNTNTSDYLYEFYKENFKEERHKYMLEFKDFFRFFQIWPDAMLAIQNVMAYYDVKFNVMSMNTGEKIVYF